MYILLDRSNNEFKILDTSDNAIEFFTIEQLKSLYLQDSSLIIYGLSNLNLIANIPIYTVLRLYDKNNVAHDFDGYTLTDACSDYNIMKYQILDVYNEPEVMNDIELFSSLYDILQRINRNLYDKRILGSTDYKYVVESTEKDYYTILDESSGKHYQCDAFTAPYIYFVEGKAIKGIELTFNCTYIGSFSYSTKTQYMKFFDCTNENKFKPVSGYVTADKPLVASDSKSIVKEFQGYDAFNVGYHFPIVDVFKYTRTLPNQECLNLRYNMLQDTIVDVKKQSAIGISGVVYNDMSMLAESFRGLNFCTEDLKDKMLDNLKLYETKCNVFKRPFDLKKLLRQTKKVGYSGEAFLLDGYKVGSRQTRDFIFNTPVGNIVVTTENCLDDCVYGNIFTTRLTNTGTVFWNFKTQRVDLLTMIEGNKDGCLCNEQFDKYLDYADRNGISYFDNVIYPLCFSEICFEDGDLMIDVACLVNGEGRGTHHSISVFKVPLIFTGCRNERYSNGWIFRTIFQTLYIPFSAVEHLYGFVDSATLVGYYSTNRKPARIIMNSVLGSADKYLSKYYEK